MPSPIDTAYRDLPTHERYQQDAAAQTFLVALTGDPGAIARFTDVTDTAYWDDQNRVMCISARARLGEIPGFMAHEVLHALDTCPKAWDEALKHASHAAINVCEDIRINVSGAAKYYRNGGAWIRATAESLIRHSPEIRQTKDIRIQAMLLCQDLGHYLDAPTPEALAWVTDHRMNVLAAKDCADPGFIAAAEALDAASGDKPGDGGAKGQGAKGQGAKGQGAKGQGAKGQGAKGQGAKPGDGKPGDGKPGDVKSGGKGRKSGNTPGTAEAAAEANAKADATGEGTGAWFKPEDHPSQGTEAGKGTVLGAQDNGRRVSNAYSTSDPVSVTPEAWAKGARYSAGKNGPVFDATMQTLARWRSRLAEALMAEDQGGWNRHQRTGQLDTRKIALIPYGTSEQVFMQRGATRKAVNTAIDLVVDQSGSTDDRSMTCAVLSATCASLAQAISRIQGTSLGVLLYDDNFCRVSPIQPGLGIKTQAIKDTCRGSGSTLTNTAVGLSSKALNDYKQAQRRICIVLTDAQPPTIAEAAAASAMGVEVHTVVIARDAETLAYVTMQRDDTQYNYMDWEHAHLTCTTNVPQALDALVRALRIRGA